MRSRPSLAIREVAYDHPVVTQLTHEVQAYYACLYGGPDSAPVGPDEFTPPNGAFFVGYDDDTPVAMGGWRYHRQPLDIPAAHPAEIKRMYVIRAARRRGHARLMLRHLEAAARAAGADAMVLETGRPQQAAVALYRAHGYRDIAAFGHYASEPSAVHLGRLLSDSSGSAQPPEVTTS